MYMYIILIYIVDLYYDCTYLVGQFLERLLDVQDELFQPVDVAQTALEVVEGDGDGGVGLVELGLEGECECLVLESRVVRHGVRGGSAVRVVGPEGDLLHLVLLRLQQVVSLVHHVVAVHAQALGAVHVAELGVALAAPGELL
jgi:hypothetical protein